MKRLISIVVALGLVIALAAPVMASPPIKPPIEGSIIATVTDIDCIGTVRETENLSWTITEDGNLAVGDYGNASGQIRYTEELRAIDGQTRLVKDFAFHSTAAESDNLDVEKDIGYAKLEGTIGQIQATEKLSIGIATADNHPLGGVAGACIWQGEAPPTNEFVAAGGSVTAQVAEVHTVSNAAITSDPRLAYQFAAMNTLGSVSAGMEVRALEGSPAIAPGDSDLLGLEVYSEHASASGIITKFVKVARYYAVVGALQPEPYYLVP